MTQPGKEATRVRARKNAMKSRRRRGLVLALTVACVFADAWAAPAPYAGKDQIILPVNTTVTTLASGSKNLLSNDGVVASSAHLNTLTPATINHVWGTLSINADGTFSAARNGSMVTSTDTYTIVDSNGATANGQVQILLSASNTAPSIAPNIGMHVHPKGETTRLDTGNLSVLDAASDPQANLLVATFGAPAHGNVVDNGNGTFIYTNTGGSAFTTDSFVVNVCESGGGLCTTTNVPITIGATHRPSVVDDQIQVVKGGTISSLIGGSTKLTGNDVDLDVGETATLTAGHGQLGGAKPNAHVNALTGAGKVTINSDGTFSYTNTNTLVNNDTFKYYACDASFVCALGTVTIELTNGTLPANHLPVTADDAIQMMPGGSSTTLVGGSSSLLANDTDQDADSLSARWVNDPDYGTISINSNGTFSYKNTVPVGSDSFQYQACDNHGACRLGTVHITFGSAAPDHPPVVIDDAIQVIKGATATSLIGDTVGNSVLDNDFDKDAVLGDILQVDLLSPPAGQLTLNADGTFLYKAPNVSLQDVFYYQACDQNHACSVGKVTVTVTDSPHALNRAPWVVDDALQTSMGGVATQLVGGSTRLQANDVDPDGDPVLTVSARSAPEKGTLNYVNSDGTLKYTAIGSTYSDSFIYQVCDSLGACTPGKVTINVGNSSSNRLPIAGDDAIQALPGSGVTQRLIGGAIPTSSVIGNDVDPDGDSLTVKAISPQLVPASGSITLNSNGTFDYTPPASDAQDTFAYEVCDVMGACAPGLITINVTSAPPDTPPNAQNDFILVKPGSVTTHFLIDCHANVLDNDIDVDGDLIGAKALSTVSAALGQKMVLYPDGSFDYTAPSAEVTDSLSYQACDSFGACSVAKVDILVRQAVPLLAIEKSAQPGTFFGGSGSYRIMVTNIGTSPTSDVITVDDPLPPGISRVSFSGSGWSCAAQGSKCIYSGAALAPGENTLLTLSVAVASGTQSANNTATLTGGGDSTCPSAAHCQATVLAGASDTAVPVLNVAMTAIPGTFVTGATGTYRITVSNAGNATATGISLRDTLPGGVSFVSGAGLGWACSTPSFVTCTYAASLPPGATTTVDVNVSVAANALAGATAASNSAVIVSGDGSCPMASHCIGSVAAGISKVVVPILSVTKSAMPATFVVGQSASYPITVTNTGGVATNALISVQDALPAGVTYSSFTGANWSCGGGKVVTCTYPGSGLNALEPGASTTVAVYVNVAAAAATPTGASNTAVASGGGDATCPQATHCRGSVIAGASSVAVPILSVAKVANEGTFVGGTGSYTITVTNTGGAPTSGSIALHDALPPGIQLTSASGANWNCVGSGDVTCTRSGAPDLAAGGSTKLTMTVSVSGPSDPIGASNTVTASGGGDVTCPAATHCSASVVAGTSSTPVPILTVSKTTTPGTFVVGQPASYVFTIKNIGAVASTGAITLTDSLPPGISYVSFGGQGWSSCTSAPVKCTTSSTLAPGASTTLTVNASVGSGAVGNGGASNAATVSGGGDPTCPLASHCTGSVIAGVSPSPSPTLWITKTATPATFAAGQAGVYRLFVANTSSQPTTGGITLHDVLPPGITMTSWVGESGANWSCSGVSDITCVNPTTNLGIGQTWAVTLTVAVDSSAMGTHGADNTVSAIAGSGGDPTCSGALPASHCSASVDVPVTAQAPTASMSFLPSTVATGGIPTMHIVLSNPNSVALTGIGFNDTYPSNNNGGIWNTGIGAVQSSTCGGTLSAPPNSSALTLTGGSLAANGSCSIAVNVVAIGAGTWTNQTGPISWNGAPAGASASASLIVTASSSASAPLAADDAMVGNAGQSATTVNGGFAHLLDNDVNPGGGSMKAFLSGAMPSLGVLNLKSDGSFTYVSNSLGAATDSFKYVACDVTSGNCSAPATVTISILAQGQPLPQIEMPIVADDAAVVDAGTAVHIVNGNADSVLKNDIDPNQGGTLIAKLVGASPTAGTLQFNLAGHPIGSGTFHYQHNDPAAGASQDAFFYEACDALFNSCAIGKVTITVLPVGTPLPSVQLPLVVDDATAVASGDSTTAVNGIVQGSVLTNDTDPNVDANGNPGSLSASLVSGNGPGLGQLTFNGDGTLTYQNTAGTSDGFFYRACDSVFNVCAIGNVAITVTPVGQTPPTILMPTPANDTANVAAGGSTSVVNGNQTSVLDNDGPDPNIGGGLNAYVVGSGPSHGNLTNFDDLGHFTYQHDGSPTTTDSFTYQACDSLYHACKAATVVITIGAAQNNVPGITCLLPKQVYTVGEVVSIDLSKLFSPPSGQSLAFSATGTPAGVHVDPGSVFLSGAPQAAGLFPLILTATAQPSQASANQNVTMEVLAAQERVFHNGFDGTNKPCQ